MAMSDNPNNIGLSSDDTEQVVLGLWHYIILVGLFYCAPRVQLIFPRTPLGVQPSQHYACPADGRSLFYPRITTPTLAQRWLHVFHSLLANGRYT
jgi:hypothetical protein